MRGLTPENQRTPTFQPAPLQSETTFPNSAEAKRVLDDLTNRGALHGFGPPEIENTLFKILSTFEENGDWHLALEALRCLTNIHSTQNDLFEMASRCRKGLDIAKRLGEEGSVRFFQNCLDSANRREQQATRWRFAAVCVFVMGLIAVGSAVLFWAIGCDHLGQGSHSDGGSSGAFVQCFARVAVRSHGSDPPVWLWPGAAEISNL